MNDIKKKLRSTYLFVIIVLTIIITLIIFGYIFYLGIFKKQFDDLIKKHLVTIFGLVTAALASFLVVILLEYRSGPIKFDFFKLKFEGSSGEIILWILIFLTFVVSIKLTWNLV
jgi:hypothetical protein